MAGSIRVGALRVAATVAVSAAVGFVISIFIGPGTFVLGILLFVAGLLARRQENQHAHLLMMIGVGLAAGSAVYFVGGVIQAASSSGRVTYE